MQFTLVAAGPNHVRYLATAAGSEGSETGLIQFSGAGDADVALEDAVVFGPLKQLIMTPVANQEEARLLLMDDGIGESNNGRAVSTVMPRLFPLAWAIDATEDDGALMLEVVSDGTANGEAYVDILFRHSLTQI